MQKHMLAVLCSAIVLVGAACTTRDKKTTEVPVTTPAETSQTGRQAPTVEEVATYTEQAKTHLARLTTSKGVIDIEFFPNEAPKTVANFLKLAESGFYNGVIFHRVIPDFMIQGGDPDGTGRGGPGYQFEDEFSSNLQHDKAGILSMANAGPGTNGSQFFITVAPTPWLDGRHTIFGQVVSGMDTVNTIVNVERDPNDRPLEPVTIEKIELVTKS